MHTSAKYEPLTSAHNYVLHNNIVMILHYRFSAEGIGEFADNGHECQTKIFIVSSYNCCTIDVDMEQK